MVVDDLSLLKRHEDDIRQCFRCGLCRSVCPSFEEIGTESASPRGRVQLAAAVLDGKIGLEGACRERMLDCLNCMRCGETCPSGVRTDRIVLDARAELARRGKMNLVKKLVFNTALKSSRALNLLARLAALGQKWFYTGHSVPEALVPKLSGMGDKNFPALAPKPAVNRLHLINRPAGKPVMRVGYFIGCATNLIFPEIAEATVRVLTRNGIEVVIPRGQVCCGIPVYSSGDFKNARKLAEKNRAIFDRLDVDCIVTDCASCSAALKHDIQDILGVKPFKAPVYDLNEFLASKIPLAKDFGEIPMKVTYHDPCHLKRGQNISSEPRDLLRMVPGVEFAEMEGADRCCGGAGTFSFTHHDLSRKVGAKKAASIRATGAEYVATPCPSCKMQLDDLIRHEGIHASTIHPVQVLDMAYRKKEEKAR
jgi:glycolate oxidase iron-sulfur subunit